MKAKIAPPKELSFIKLELLGLLITVRSLNFVAESLHIPPEIRKICWTDSKCVLYWLQTTEILFTFVQNRVNEIKKTSHVEFRYVATSTVNTADIPSRGTIFADLSNNTLW